MKVDQLTGAALDWAVAKCEGYTCLHKTEGRMPHEPQLVMWPPRKAYGLVDLWELGYSTDWAQGGAIIEREGLTITHQQNQWAAQTDDDLFAFGPTPLIAAMRCYIASKLGGSVNIPEGVSHA